MGERNGFEDREQVRALVVRAARLLDDGSWEKFLELLSRDATYVLQARSEELGKDMTWLEADRAELATLFKEYPQHIRDKGRRTHLVTPEEIETSSGAGKAFSTFAVFRTDLAGQSELYAVGHYEDELVLEDGAWKLRCRRVKVTTRQFTTPTPLPL
ncbi:MAG TPA: nuclear transport factor 2 family protein [Dehalococcoidia bacterium]|nr:nuclear transport factor 2 family protein [Dehalococcoidia bacterium]